ncbi:MAG: DHH family phosphoesterase [Patescibacteria group bacterium]|nr:DHH family phosphoesterase [Patescibacteria group bacterium]
MTKNKAQIVDNIIRKSKNIALMGHRDGDGDCYGAMIGLYLSLIKLGKNVQIYSENDLPDSLQFLRENNQIIFTNKYQEEIDCFVILDTSDKNIISVPSVADKYFSDKRVTSILLDHHERGELAANVDCAWVEQKYCSTAELVFDLIKGMEIDIDSEIATALLTGIDTDTSSFQTQNTTSEAFASASYLIDKGARLYDIVQNTYFNNTVDSLKIRALVIDRLVVNRKYNVAMSYLLNEDFRNLCSEEASRMIGQANFLNTLKSKKMIIFMSEIESGVVRVSLRTRDHKVDVSKFAKALGGGGHVKAAGFLIKGHLIFDGSVIKIV